MKKEVSAVVVARKGSVRVQGKNKKLLGGTPLFARKLAQLQKCASVNRVIFGSDDDEMLRVAESMGCETIRRPDFFCDEAQASANDMIGNMMDSIDTGVVVWAHCTNPLISSQTYDLAVQTFLENLGTYDSLLSVVELREHLWHETPRGMEPLNYDPTLPRHTPARELSPYYMQDGGIFIQPYEQMKRNRYFFGRKPYLFKIPESEFLDINTERDMLLAQAIIDAQGIAKC